MPPLPGAVLAGVSILPPGLDDGSAIRDVANMGVIRVEDFRDHADGVVDVAQGFGEDVRVLGLSAGGVVSAWIAQDRDDGSRALAEMYLLAKAVQDQARAEHPADDSIAVVTDANDDQVDNGDVRRRLVGARCAAGGDVDTCELPKDLGLRQDLINVGRPDRQTELVCPRLTELLGL